MAPTSALPAVAGRRRHQEWIWRDAPAALVRGFAAPASPGRQRRAPGATPPRAHDWNWFGNAMLTLLLLITSVGLADSIDPAMIVPALYFAPGPRGGRRMAGFASGVFVVNIVGGSAIALGPGRFLVDLVPHPGTRTTHALELVAAAVLLVAAIALWRLRSGQPHASRERLGRASPLVGATIALAQLPTAVPYMVIIFAVVHSHMTIAPTIALLAAYQVLYLAPVLVICVFSERSSHSGGTGSDRVRSFFARYENRLVSAILFVVAVVLLALGTSDAP